MSTYNALTAYTDTKAFVDATQAAGTAAIARLTDAATKWTYTARTAVTNLTLASLSAAAGTKPSILTPTLPTLTPADFSGIVTSALPSAPSFAGATTIMWSETFWTDLKTRLNEVLANVTGSDDVDTLVVKLTSEQDRMAVALFAKDYERKTQTLRDLNSAADAQTGARGFSFPNSMTTALRLDAQQKYQFDLSEVGRSLTTHIFAWAKSNYQFSLQQGISAHNSDVEFNIKYLDALISSYTATVNGLMEKYRTDIVAAVAKADLKLKEFAEQFTLELSKQTQLEEIRIKEAGFDLEVAKSNADIAAKDLTIKIEDFKARVQSFLQTSELDLKDRDANIKNQISGASAAATATIALAAGASTITLNTAGA